MEPRRAGRRPNGGRRISVAAVVIPAVLFSAACGASDSSPDDVSERTDATTAGSSTVPDRSLPPERRPTPVPTTSQTSVVTGEVPAGLLDEIMTDAAGRLSAVVADIDVVRAEAVTWPDGSLGCPEPGMVYTQAVVPGFWVVLGADDQQLDYRVGRQGSFRLCGNTTTAVPPMAGSDGAG